MERIKIALDTSALISLGCGDVLHDVFQEFECVSTMRVKEELQDMSKIDDRFGVVASDILEGSMDFVKVKPQLLGESEVVALAVQDSAIEAVFMDDVPARKKLQPACRQPILFSPALVYYLCLKRIITWSQGWNIVERMAFQRTWKNNIIYESAKQEWKR